MPALTFADLSLTSILETATGVLFFTNLMILPSLAVILGIVAVRRTGKVLKELQKG